MVRCPRCGSENIKVLKEGDAGYSHSPFYCMACELYFDKGAEEPTSGLVQKKKSLFKKLFETPKWGRQPTEEYLGARRALQNIAREERGGSQAGGSLLKRMRGAIIKDVYAWIPAIISLIIFVWLGTITKNTALLAGGVLFSISLAVPKGEYFGAFKAIIKFVGILLLSIGFLSLYPFAGLVALFLGYISMPVKVRVKEEEQTYNNAIGFSRMILGILLAVFILIVLGGDNALKIPMFLIALGFFFAIPEASEDIPKGAGVTVINYLGKKGDAAAALSGILILAGVVLGALQLTLWSATWIIFVSVGLVGAFTAFRSHAAERGTMGAPIVALLLITLSTTYPALLGESIFGAWWPTVDNFFTTTFGPIGTAWEQATGGMGSAWMMMTNPSEYYAIEMQKQQTAANIKSGGTQKSIEVSESEFVINNVPEQALVGSATLENKGEFTANNLKVILNPPSMKSKDRGVLEPEEGFTNYNFKTCSGGAKSKTKVNDDTCSWTGPSYSGDQKQIVFTYGEKGGKTNWNEIGECICSISDSEKLCTKEGDIYDCKFCKITDDKGAIKPCTEAGGTVTYPNAGRILVVGFNYSFNYIVNVSLDLQLMQSSTLDDMLLKKQIRLQTVKADYSGGPVKASISTLKQPVRAGEDTFAVISIENQGTGTVKKGAKYILTMPSINKKPPIITLMSGSHLSCKEMKPTEDYSGLQCDLSDDLPKGSFAKYAFMFKYDISNVDRKSVIFVGNVDYKYENSKEMSTQITWVPTQ